MMTQQTHELGEFPLTGTTSHQNVHHGQMSTEHRHSGSHTSAGSVMQRTYSAASRNARSKQCGSRLSDKYDIPESYQNLDDVYGEVPVQNPDENASRKRVSQEEAYGAQTDSIAGHRPSSHVSSRQAKRRSSASRADYDVPDAYLNIPEASQIEPVHNRGDAATYRHESLEQSRSRDQEYIKRQQSCRRESHPQVEAQLDEKHEAKVSQLVTQIYTISYLILFSILGTLARLGLQALTYYPGAPVPFSSVWPNFGGSLVMGFLSEDRMLFREEWGTPTYDEQIRKAGQTSNDEENGPGSEEVNLAAAKKAHMATKKTIPLYIGLATGFCGSFTSFSSFIRDVFLALSNDMPTPNLGSLTLPRNGGYSFMAIVAVIITTVSLSLAGLFLGAHVAIVLEPITPSLPFAFTRRVFDRIAVFIAWGCWLGAILLSILPPDRFNKLGASETWRGRATFSLVFAPLGCLARFYASLHLNGRIASFPLGTFVVNVFGTAILGMAYDIQHLPAGGVIGCQVLQGIEDGFCGCLTTVSTWVAELSSLRRSHSYIYGGTSVVVALALMVAVMGGLKWSEGFTDIVCLK